MRRAPAGPALVKQNDPIDCGIKVPPQARRTTRPRAAMKHERRLSVGSTAHLPIKLMPIADLEPAALVGFKGGVEVRHRSKRT